MSPLLRRSLLPGCLVVLAVLLAPAAAKSQQKGQRLDAQGDPLPDGALARLGSVRLRHGAEVYTLSFTPDSKAIASLSGDQTFRLWDVISGKELRRFERKGQALYYGASSGRGKFVMTVPGVVPAPVSRDFSVGDGQGFTVAHSADGKLLALVDPQNLVLLLDAVTGKLLRKFELHDRAGHALAISADGKLLACGEAGGEDHTVRLWDLANDKELPPLQVGKQRMMSKLLFSPDNKQLAGISGGQVRLWDLTTGKRTRLYEGHDNQVMAIAFAADSQKLASAGADGTVRLWEIASEEELKKFTVNDNQFTAVAFTPDGRQLVAASATDVVYVWDLASGQEKFLLEGHKGGVLAVAVSPDSKWIATAGTRGDIRLWNAATGKEVQNNKQFDRVDSFGLLADGHTAVTWTSGGMVRTVDLLTGAEHMSVKGPVAENLQYETSLDGKMAAVWNVQEDGLVLWDSVKGAELHKLTGHPGGVAVATFSADGKLLATAGQDAGIRIWKVATGKELFGGLPIGTASGCAFSPDGKLLAAVVNEGELVLVEMLTGKERSRTRLGRTGGYNILAFSPDGRLLAFTAGDEVIRIWDVVQCKLLRGLVGHQDAVATLAFSAKGDVLASGSDDGTVRLWKVESGEEVRCFEGHQGPVTRVLFTPDGKAVVSGAQDGCVLMWDALSPGKAAPGNTLAKQFDVLWAGLGEADGMQPFQAVALKAPKETVAFLAKKLQPVPSVEPAHIDKLVADLDHKTFAVRQKATRELEKLEGQARPALTKASAKPPSAEVHSRLRTLLDRLDGPVTATEDLRALRAVELLTLIGSPEARELLRGLARGAPGARLTQEAADAIKRLN